MDDKFQRVEDEYFRLKGLLAAGRITREQYETALKDNLVQDGLGRWWMVGVDSGKWYYNDGANWVEADPSNGAPLSPTAAPGTPRSESSGLGKFLIIALICAALGLVVLAGGLYIVSSRGILQLGFGATAAPTANHAATRTVEAQSIAGTVTAIAQRIAAEQTAAAPTMTPIPSATPTPTVTATRTATPTLVPPTMTATPRPVGNCSDPGAQLSFQDGYRPDPFFHIIGTAKSPNMQSYLMEFADRTDNPQWRRLRDPVPALVENNELALWVMSTVGGYQWYVRVTVFLNDGTALAPCVRWIQQR